MFVISWAADIPICPVLERFQCRSPVLLPINGCVLPAGLVTGMLHVLIARSFVFGLAPDNQRNRYQHAVPQHK